MMYAWPRWYLEEATRMRKGPDRKQACEDNSQDIVFTEIGMDELTTLIHESHSNHKFSIQLRKLSRRNIRILQSWGCPEERRTNQLCSKGTADRRMTYFAISSPSPPKNSITNTFSLHSTTLGHLTPPSSNLLRFLNSFSAHTRTIFRGFVTFV
jgi:hypothetical protein